MERWEDIILFMNSKRDEFLDKERNSIFQKYSVLAYSKLLREIEQDEPNIIT